MDRVEYETERATLLADRRDAHAAYRASESEMCLSECVATVQRAFHDADNLMRAQPAEFHDDLTDLILRWAVRQYLPCSSYYTGLLAYAIHPEDAGGRDGQVFIAHVARRPGQEVVEIDVDRGSGALVGGEE